MFKQSAYAKAPALVDPTAWKQSTRAVHEASNAYRNAASSSGLFNTQQIRATSEAEKYTKALQKQKLSFSDMRKHQGIMREVYRDQLRMQRMSVQHWGTDSAGRAVTDIAVPKSVPRDLDTMRNRMGMFSAMAKSAGANMVNLGKNIQWAGRQLTVGFSYPVALFGAAAGVMAFQVEDAFAKINKVYDVSAAAQKNEALRTKEIGQLRVDSMKNATEVAKQYGLVVTKTLAVEQELAATGLTGKELMSSTTEVQRISALGDIEPADTTKMVLALKNSFRDTIKDGDDLTEVLNFMNATSNATSLSLQDIAQATPRAASGLAQLGVDAKQMTVMLVAMTEAGIDAAEAANALKSFTTRLLNPAIVEKSAKVFREAGASFDLTDIVEKSGKNAYKFLELMGDAINKEGPKLTNEVKAQAVAALAGTYQFNRLFAAIGNFSTAQGEANNQTAKAKELLGENSEALALMAENSRKAMVENPAGRFKQAWAAFQIELSEMGGPFLEAATKILGVFSKIGEGFNNLPGWQKKVIMFIAAVAAIAGPIIMIGGLFANLFGHFVGGVGKIGALITSFKIFTTQETAAAKTTELTNKTLMTQGAITANLAKEVNVLTAAYAAATAAAKAYAVSTMPMPAGMATGRPQVMLGMPSMGNPASPGTMGPHLPPVSGPVAYQYRRGESPAAAQAAAMRAAQLAEMRRLQAQDKITAATREQARQAAKVAENHNKAAGAVNGMTVGMGVASVAMGALMFGAEGTAASIAKMALLGTMVIPAAIALVKWLMVAVAQSAAYAKNMWSGAAGSRAGMVGGLVSGLGKFATSATGIVSIVAAVGGGIYLWKKHLDGVRDAAEAAAQAQDKAMATLVDSTKAWAEATGEAYQNYVKYNAEGGKDIANKKTAARMELIKQYQDMETKATVGKKTKTVKVTDQWDDMTDSQQQFTLEKKVIELIQMGNNIDDVRDHVTAFLEAVGESGYKAASDVETIISRLGTDPKTMDWDSWISNGFKAAAEATANGDDILAKSIRSSVGLMFVDAFETEENKKAFTNKIANVFEEGYVDAQSDFKSMVSGIAGDGGLEMLFEEMSFHLPKDSVEEAKKLINSLMTDVDKLKGMSDSDLDKLGDELFSFLSNGASGVNPAEIDEWVESLKKAKKAEKDFYNAAGEDVGVEGIDNAAEFAESLIVRLKSATTEAEKLKIVIGGLGQDSLAAVASMVSQFNDFKNLSALSPTRMVKEAVYNQGMSALSPIERAMVEWKTLDRVSDETLAQIRFALEQIDFEKLPEGVQNFLRTLNDNGAELDIDVDDSEVDEAARKIGALPSYKRIGLDITTDQARDVIRTGMETTMDEMVGSATNNFNAGWDARMAGAQAAHDRAGQAFDNRAEKRKEAVERFYKAREDLINKQIEAEERADTIRQRLFDKERTRLQRLAELQNQNIDFNTAINEGRLDDAAKIGNDAVAKDATNAMDDEQQAAENASADKREALEKRIQALNERREKQLKRLDKLQERMRQHMERAQANQIRGLEQQRAAEEASLQDRLTLFKSYTGRNQQDLEAWMKKVGLTYEDFGRDVKLKGNEWATHFEERLRENIHNAGVAVSNDNMWEKAGGDMANKLVRGMGFINMEHFKNFINTGKMKMDNGRPYPGFVGPVQGETRHEGGIIGGAGSSRGNIPNTYKGLHRSETMVRAQKGEYVINKKSASKYGDVLGAINSGNYHDGIMGGATGPMGIMAAGMYGMLRSGVGQAFANLKASTQESAKKAGSTTYNGPIGGRNYPLPGVVPWAKEAAQYLGNKFNISSIGGVGTRPNASDHPTGHALDFMVSDERGTSLSNEVIRLKNVMDATYLIWRQRIHSLDSRGWQNMEDRGSPTANHMDHVHVSFARNGKVGDLPRLGGASGGGGGFIPGGGGKHRPINASTSGRLHGNPPAFDFAAPVGTPLKAVADGRITRSYDIPGYEPRASHGGLGYKSYGRVVEMRTDNGGHNVLYAHLSRRSVVDGQHVKGGSTIGYSGNTGNSSGPHLHFGASNGPSAWLRMGGTIRHDNTPVIAHKGETMLSSSLTRQFKDNVAAGSDSGYSVVIDLRGAYIKEDVDIEKAVNKAIDNRENKRGRSRKVTD